MKIRRLFALIFKESLQILRDPSAMLIAFVLPLILLFIFGYGVNLDSNRVKIGLVLETRNPDVISLAQAFMNSHFLDVTIGHDRRAFSDAVMAGKLRGMVVIPQNFITRGIDENRTADIQVITDGSEPNIASFVQNYAQGVLQIWIAHQQEDRSLKQLNQPIITAPRFWYNPELKSRNFLVPGSIAIIMTLIGTILTALVVAREWERGTMEALMASPVSIVEILLGKLIPYFLLGLGSMLICFLVATLFYAVPFHGSLPALALCTAVFLVTALGQGLLISTIAKNQFVAAQIALMSAFLPAFMLSGFIFEISAMPAPIQTLTYLVPARYFVTSLQTLFLAGNVWPLLLSSMASVALIGFAFFLLMVRKTRKRLD